MEGNGQTLGNADLTVLASRDWLLGRAFFMGDGEVRLHDSDDILLRPNTDTGTSQAESRLCWTFCPLLRSARLMSELLRSRDQVWCEEEPTLR